MSKPKLKIVKAPRKPHVLRYDTDEGTLTFYSERPITYERLNFMLDKAKRDLWKEYYL